MIESIITKIIISLVKSLGISARNSILNALLQKTISDRQEERAEVISKIEVETSKPKEEQSDEELIKLHRRLRDIDSI